MKINLRTTAGRREAARSIKNRYSHSQSWNFFYRPEDQDFADSPGLLSWSGYEDAGYQKIYTAYQLHPEDKAPTLDIIETELIANVRELA